MRHVFLAGVELAAPELPDGAEVLRPPRPAPPLADVRRAVERALRAPVAGAPLPDQIRPRDRVVIVFDSPAYPVPAVRQDPRVAALEAILALVESKGVPRDRVELLCASGLGRRWSAAELAPLTGDAAQRGYRISCHDAEDLDDLTGLGATASGEPVELNGSLSRADRVISLSVVQVPINGGWSTVAGGLASPRMLRALYGPRNLAGEVGAMDAGRSPLRAALERAGRVVEKSVPVFHVELVLNNRLFPAPLERLLRTAHDLTPPMTAWNRIPAPLRGRAARLFRAEYAAAAVFAGTTAEAHEAALTWLEANGSVKAERPCDIALVGVPSIGPHTAGSFGNPVLTATFAFGHLLGWSAGQRLIRRGGAAILLGDFTERFDRRLHLPYEGFWDGVLRDGRDPFQMADRHEHAFVGRPEYVSAYRWRSSCHALHPFMSWYQAWPALEGCGRVYAVGAPPSVASRLGFVAVATFKKALEAAQEAVGVARARVAALGAPPAFGIRWGSD